MMCALLNKAPSRVALPSGDCQKPGELGFHLASNTEQMVADIGPVALIPATGHGGLFPPKSAGFCVLCRHYNFSTLKSTR